VPDLSLGHRRSGDGSPSANGRSRTPLEPTVVTPLAAIADAVRGSFAADRIEMTGRRLRLLDTVDRRLTASGSRLETEAAEGGGKEVGGKEAGERWRLVDADGRVRAEATIRGRAPTLADDLPDGPLRQALEKAISIRGLVASPWIALTEHSTALRDAAGKTRCRLVARTAQVETTGEQRSAVRVEALKGYRREARSVAERVTRRFGWTPAAPDPLTALAPILWPEPGGTADPAVSDIAQPAGPGLRLVLRALLDAIEARSRGVIADIDDEELHDLRVAIRRTRSILALLRSRATDSKQADRTLERARATFAWLGQATGPTRDLDVHILAWRAHRRRTSAEQAAILEPLGRYLAAERAAAHAALVRALRSRRFRTALARWRAVLDAGDQAWTGSEALRRPIGELAGHRIRKLYRRAVREGTAITPDSPAEALHALRKTMKKLRYVVEIIRPGVPADRVRPVLRRLRALQQVLGDVQDMEVQADALRRFGLAMGETGLAGPATLMAIGAQAEDLEIRRAEARDRFAAVFAPVAKRNFGDKVRALAGTRAGDGA